MKAILSYLVLFYGLIISGYAAPLKENGKSKEITLKVKKKLEANLREQGFKWGLPVFIRIYKDPALLEIWLKKHDHFVFFKSYKICRFSGKLGPKLQEGDMQAPEGFYRIYPEQLNPWSSYHLAVNIGYPNRFDQENHHTGNNIMIHGNCASVGCFAMTDGQMEEIYVMIQEGLKGGKQKFIPIHIFPFPPTPENLEAVADLPWINFWRKLAVGFEFFQLTRIPPVIISSQGDYLL